MHSSIQPFHRIVSKIFTNYLYYHDKCKKNLLFPLVSVTICGYLIQKSSDLKLMWTAEYQILGPKTKLFDPIIQKSQDYWIKFSSYIHDISKQFWSRGGPTKCRASSEIQIIWHSDYIAKLWMEFFFFKIWKNFLFT